MIDTHLAVYHIKDFCRQRHRCELNHQKSPFLTANYRNDYRNRDCNNKYDVDELRMEFWYAANFAYDSPDAILFLLKSLQFLLQISDFVLKMVEFLRVFTVT